MEVDYSFKKHTRPLNSSKFTRQRRMLKEKFKDTRLGLS
jgi:hypothetical protein